jgi:hypothetical protein
MADKYKIDNSINYRFKDLGDGSYAPVVAIEGGINLGDVTVSAETEISNDIGNPIPVTSPVPGFSIPTYDYINVGYTGANPSTVVYKTGGADGTVVCTLVLAYDSNNNVTSVTKV